MTQYTENYQLELYEGTDKADLTDQYNVSMGLIDTALKGVDTDTKAEVARLEGDLATTNSNLNATNQNAAALKKEVEDNYAQQLATDAQQQTEIDALKTTVDDVPSTYATQDALQAVKTEVDKNTPLVEEHVNYFTDLGVTDEQSANDLHNQIDNAYQGVMSNTQAIQEIHESLQPWTFLQRNSVVFGANQTNKIEYDLYSMNGFIVCVAAEGTLSVSSNQELIGEIVFPDGIRPQITGNQCLSSCMFLSKQTGEWGAAFNHISTNGLQVRIFNNSTDARNVTSNQLPVAIVPAGKVEPTPPEPSRNWTGEFVGKLLGDDQFDIGANPPVRFAGSIDPTNKTLTVNAVSPVFQAESRTPEGSEITVTGYTVPGVSGTAWKIFSDAALPAATKTLTGGVTLATSGSQWVTPTTLTASLVVNGGALYAVFENNALGVLAETINMDTAVDVTLSVNATNVSYE